MVLQKENNPFGTTRSLNGGRASGMGIVWKQTGTEKRTDTGRHSMKHFSTINHNVLFCVYVTGNQGRIYQFTSTSQNVNAGMAGC
jgi:hypothetical protein